MACRIPEARPLRPNGRRTFIGRRAILLAGFIATASPILAERVRAPEAEAAFTAGDYAEAYRRIEAALAACKETVAEPDRCLGLMQLAPSIASASGDAVAAERLARAALAAVLALPGHKPEDEIVTRAALAAVLLGEARLAEAEAMHRAALTLARSSVGDGHPLTGMVQNGLALALDAQDRHGEAEPLHRAAVAGIRASMGPDSPMLPTLVTGLGDNLTALARWRDADPVYAEAVRLARKLHGDRHPATAMALTSHAQLKQTLGQFAPAEALLREATAINAEALGPDHPLVGRDHANLGALFLEQGRFVEAEAEYRKALTIAEKDGPAQPAVASDLGNLAGVLRLSGRADAAEPLARRALEIDRAAFGEQSARVAGQLGNIAALLEEQGKASEAEPLRRRALAIREALHGERHPDSEAATANLAGNLSQQARYDAARPLLRKALAIARSAHGRQGAEVARVLKLQGVVEARAGNDKAALPLFRQAIAIDRKRLGERHPDTATGWHNLAFVLERSGQPSQAEQPARQALTIRRAILPALHPDIAASEALLATILARQAATRAEALDHARRAVEIARARGDAVAETGSLDGLVQARRGAGGRNPLDRAFAALIETAWARAQDMPAEAEALRAEAFAAAQELDISAAGLAMAQTTARTAAGDGPLARLVRRQQDLSLRIRQLDQASIEALGANQSDKAAALRRDVDTAAADLAAIDAELRGTFPTYSALISPHALPAAEVARRLAPDEGLLLVVPVRTDMFVFALSPGASAWQRVADGGALVGDRVGRLRCSLDRATCPEQADASPTSLPFDIASAAALHAALIAPVEPVLTKAKRLFVTGSGPIADLPLDLLVATDAGGGLDGVQWLGDRYAMTSLPAISALQPRRPTTRSRGGTAFIGYGDPVLGAEDAATSFLQQTSYDLGLLRALPSLPGTRTELHAMAQALGNADGVVLGKDATEAAVRADRRLADARVVAFATHGLLPGELNGRNEPGLVLTPPMTASATDDGLLSASEAAELRLDADWVILSACNTAASQGSADSLSALARAFLYAGAHGLLASHWRVADDATAALTVETLAAVRSDPALGRAGARQAAMRAIRTGRRADGTMVPGWSPAWRHPAAWAPFSVYAASSD